MKKVFTLLTVLSFCIVSFSQKKSTTANKKTPAPNNKTQNPKPAAKVIINDEGHDITLTLTPAKNQKAYLA